jgi:CRISPR-associated protein Cas2
MYIIIVYDVEQKRVAKVCQFLRRYLNWVQNSVFEGSLTDARFKELKMGLKTKIKKENDSILFYILADESFVTHECMGVEKNSTDTFI